MLKSLIFSILIVGCCRVDAQTCFDTDTKVECDNCDFSDADDIATVKSKGAGPIIQGHYWYADVTPKGWQTAGGSGLSLYKSPTWFPNNPPNGKPFAFLFCGGHALYRTLLGLDVDRPYLISFYAAERRGYGSEELMAVRVNGVYIAEAFSPAEAWTRYTYTFVPNAKGEALIEVVNAAPTIAGACNSKTVFLSDVEIAGERGCGTGAECHNPIAPSITYTCRCDASHVGTAVVGGAANCTHSNDLVERLDDVQQQTNEIEKGLVQLTQTVTGIQDAIALSDARLDRMEGKLDLLLSLFNGSTLIPASALQVSPEPTSDGATLPAITATHRGLDMILQPRQRLKVNGASVLTADEVKAMIRDAVEGAFKSVGDGMGED
eukprot:m.11129 g.11129  ORF g.11129 m.11129 type:complete len:378 (+) comp8671_c0_seq1:222-1355(+)